MPHHLGLLLVDLAQAAHRLPSVVQFLNDPVAVGEAAGGQAGCNATALTSPDLGSEIAQEQGIHRALEANVKFVDFAFGQGDDFYARKT
jgi:molecular chaperone DnaK (HSP70)